MKKQQLSSDDWIRAGLQTLALQGPGGLRAEPLARQLGTTKGSFYWHFKDVPAFQTEMLETWEALGATAIINALEEIPDPAQRLRALGRAAAQSAPAAFGGPRLEPAIRAWSLSDTAAATAVARVDDIRLDYLRELLAQRGITNPEFSRIIYAAYLGLDDLGARGNGNTTSNAQALETLIDLVLTLDD